MEKQDCTIRKWSVIDVYRKTYPAVIDTSCGSGVILFNKVKINQSFYDSITSHNKKEGAFYYDTIGNFEVIANSILNIDGTKYAVSKIRYLARGYTIDQEFLFWVANNEIYAQQERDSKKIYLLVNVSNKHVNENKEKIAESIMNDTMLFPRPPKLY